jgi:hypothetical protein
MITREEDGWHLPLLTFLRREDFGARVMRMFNEAVGRMRLFYNGSFFADDAGDEA